MGNLFGQRFRAAILGILGWGALLAPPRAAAQQTPQLRLVDDRDRQELVFELGPVDLPAHLGHEHAAQPPTDRVAIPIEGWVHGFRVEVVDGAGRAVPQQVVHHVNIIATEERELFSQIMLRVAAAGQETGEVKLPRLAGYRVRKGQEFAVTSMLHNPTPRAYRGVKVRVRMPYTPESSWLSPVSIFPFYLDVMPPAGETHAYDLPPGRSEKSWEGRPALAGRILGVGGHLHKYGVSLRLEDVTANEVLWEAKPKVDEKGEVIDMPRGTFIWRLGIPVRSDHVYRLTAIYDNPTGETIPDGAMGALGGVFLPARGTVWPVVDRQHPEYQLDVRVTLADGGGHGGHQH